MNKKTKKVAILGIVFGALSFAFASFSWVALNSVMIGIIQVIGLIFGIMGILFSAKTFEDKNHEALAIAGLVISIIGTILSCFVLSIFMSCTMYNSRH